MAGVSFLLAWVQNPIGNDLAGLSRLALVRLLWYVAALSVTPGRRTVRRMQSMVGACPTDRHGIERLLKDKPDATRDLLRTLGHGRLAAALERKRRSRIFVVVDTTNLVRFGRRMEAAFRFKDNSTRGYVVGHRVVVAIAVVGKSLIPLGCRLFVRKEDAPRLRTRYYGQIDLAEQLIGALPDMPGGPQVEVLGDSFFSCAGSHKLAAAGRTTKGETLSTGLHVLSLQPDPAAPQGAVLEISRIELTRASSSGSTQGR